MSSVHVVMLPPPPRPPAPPAAVKYYNPVTRLALVRAPGARAADVRAALALTKAIKKRPAALHVLQVAGSARTLGAYLRHWQRTLAATAAASSDDSAPLDAALLAALDADLEGVLPPAADGGGPAAARGGVARPPAR